MSLLGTLIRPKTLAPTSTIAAAAAACASTAGRRARARRKEYHTSWQSEYDSISGRRQVRGRVRGTTVEDVFIQSLVAASRCRQCSIIPPATARPRSSSRSSSRANREKNLRHRSRTFPQRAFSTTTRSSQAEAALQDEEDSDASRKDYEDLVDTYDSLTLREPEREVKPEHFRLAPRLTLTPEQESRPPHGKRQILQPIDEDHWQKLWRLRELLANKPGHLTNRIWRLYLDLPTPRLRYISDEALGKLFQHLAWVEVRGLKSSQRYFSLLEEALGERAHIGAANWNTAISFAGRWVRKLTPDDVKAAIETWLRMEREGGVSANNITFNILFDVAVKAGRFALADTIYAEMVRRGMELNRYFRTSKIYYAGKRGDAENVRAAFRELVAAGEIVDTAIMNCVILSLVRCGEAASAENVMGKMKLLHEQKFGTASLEDWRDKKAMGRQLDESARQLRKENNNHLESFFGTPFSNDEKKEEIQRAAPIAPDELTYRILIKWHADVSGNLDKISAYVDEIKAAGYKVQHNLFFQLFKGFFKHGGYAFTAWNRKALEVYWKEFMESIVGDAARVEMVARLKAREAKMNASGSYEVYPLDPSDAFTSFDSEVAGEADEEKERDTDPPPSHLAPTEFRAGTVMAALAAFYKCAGSKRMLEVWDEVQERWTDLGAADRRRIEDVIAEKTREAGVYMN